MLRFAKMNYAHQDTSREGETSIFGCKWVGLAVVACVFLELILSLTDDLANTFSPPTPPTLSNTRGIPLLTSAEADNNTQFLDYFMNNTSGPSHIFDTFDHIQADSLPNFHGMSSAYGRPDTKTYDTAMFTNPTLDWTRHFDTNAPYTNRNVMIEAQRQPMVSSLDFQQRPFSNNLEQAPPVSRRPPRPISNQPDPTALGFGSDAAFNCRRYVAPAGQDESAVTGKLLAVVETLELAPSVPNSQPASPIIRKKSCKGGQCLSRPQPPQVKKRTHSDLKHNRSEKSSDDDMDSSNDSNENKVDRPPWKNYRRNSKAKVNDIRRQNLTDKEKRENHIRSEQKRRNQIKDGFAGLLAMMPDSFADGSGHSKCNILSKSVDWLTEMKDGNDQLKAQLLELGGSV